MAWPRSVPPVEDAEHQLGAAHNSGAAHDGTDVHLHRAFGNPEPRRDFLVRQSLEEKLYNLLLSQRKGCRSVRLVQFPSRSPPGHGTPACGVAQLIQGGSRQNGDSPAGEENSRRHAVGQRITGKETGHAPQHRQVTHPVLGFAIEHENGRARKQGRSPRDRLVEAARRSAGGRGLDHDHIRRIWLWSGGADVVGRPQRKEGVSGQGGGEPFPSGRGRIDEQEPQRRGKRLSSSDRLSRCRPV